MCHRLFSKFNFKKLLGKCIYLFFCCLFLVELQFYTLTQIRSRTRHWTMLRYSVLVFSVESKLENKLVVSLSHRLGIARDTKVSIIKKKTFTPVYNVTLFIFVLLLKVKVYKLRIKHLKIWRLASSYSPSSGQTF
jgi:hypothetical protein